MMKDKKEKTSILLVDDDINNLNVLLDCLTGAGFKILIAPDGERALQQTQEVHPNLILLDVMMPGIDGFETCRRMKADPRTQDIPIIFMTALSDTLSKIKGFEAGGVDYITKPFQQEEVIARVNTHLTIRQQQEQIQEKNLLLEQLNATKDKFFSIISHDLKNIFSGLMAYPETIRDNLEMYSQDDLKQALDMISKYHRKLYALLENLLTWSRIQRGSMDYTPANLDLGRIGRRNIQLLLQNAQQKQLHLASTIPDNTMVYADDNMTDTVLRNLLSNAMKFTHSGGEVTLSAFVQESHIEVSITDTGLGIPDDKLLLLFRIDKTFKRLGTEQEQGTGLGLILCKELVEKQGGTMWVTSEVNKGSTFTFTLPRFPKK